MSRTLTMMTDAPLAAQAAVPKDLIDALYARGVRAVPSARAGELLFSRDASTPPVVATAVRFAADVAVDKAL